jgi:branched-subunit amino acid aminotransferase/4-amino-4-deoxychorismate lyase
VADAVESKSAHIAPGAPSRALRETCRVVDGRIPLWPYHRSRLEAAGCSDTVLGDVEARALAAAAEWDHTESPRVRLSITVSPDAAVAVDVRRRLSTLDVPGGPVCVRVDVTDIRDLPVGAAKPADRAWWDEAQRRARLEGGHQAVITGPRGRVIDGGTATVWIAEGPVLITPPAPPAVAGVARAFLIQAAPDAHIRVEVEPVTWKRFEHADEAFLTNALAGVAPVRDRGGMVYRAVTELFEEMWRAAC